MCTETSPICVETTSVCTSLDYTSVCFNNTRDAGPCCVTFFRLPRHQVYMRLDTAHHGLPILILVIGGTDTGECAGLLSKLKPLDG